MPNSSFIRFNTLHIQRLLTMALLAISAFILTVPAQAQSQVNPNAAPNDFVQAVADNALAEVKRNRDVQSGDMSSINQVIDQYVLPYVNFEKTTRLAAGRHWRQATDQQKKDLIEAFKGTLIRTYGGALSNVDQNSAIKMQPFRGDASADDVVVRSLLTQNNGPAVAVDYRLEKTPQGWKIYDLNVENIWLIQNYRNQFAQQIAQNGIDGLIEALNRGGK